MYTSLALPHLSFSTPLLVQTICVQVLVTGFAFEDMQTVRNWRWGRNMGVGNYGKDVMFEIGIERQKSSRWGDEKALMGTTKRQRHGGLRDLWNVEIL